MNLRDLLRKHEEDGVTFHSSQQNIDIGVLPNQDGIVVRESSTETVHFRGPYHGEQQIRLLLEEHDMRTDNFHG